MNGLELDLLAEVKTRDFLKEANGIRICKESRSTKELFKPLVMNLSDLIIRLGTRLHNWYQPSIEEILVDFIEKKSQAPLNRK